MTRNCAFNPPPPPTPTILVIERGGVCQRASGGMLFVGFQKPNSRVGTPNLSIKSERGTTGTAMFHSGQGVEWYQVRPDSLPPWRVILKKPAVPITFWTNLVVYSLFHHRLPFLILTVGRRTFQKQLTGFMGYTNVLSPFLFQCTFFVLPKPFFSCSS